jgi:deoxyribodipyrimidine photo-lyase
MSKLPEIAICWLRRDLRLHDQAALSHALQGPHPVLPIFIFDPNILDHLEEKKDRRVDFLLQVLSSLQKELQQLGSSLRVFNCTPLEAFETIQKEFTIRTVYTNHDYEPYAIARDASVQVFLGEKGIAFNTFKDQCVFEKNEVTKDDGKPYTIFTPYSVRWKKALTPAHYKAYETKAYFGNFYKCTPFTLPSLESLGFQKTEISISIPKVEDDLLIKYKEQRDYPAIAGTSRLSMHLRFGTVSIRSLVARSITTSETWLNELIWRDFYMMILSHFPHVVTGSFKRQYDKVLWRNDELSFTKWCEGKTGFPMVDAGMRELNATGFMHNRVRMIVSSFLVKDLLVDWRLGEAYFAQHLNDFDLSANNGGWQWAAGSGCDAAPYFRIFNPTEQQKKFDPEFKYIRKWIPEFGTPAYPAPIVDHAMARTRTLSAYKAALTELK